MSATRPPRQSRFFALFDSGAWMLMFPAAALLYWLDAPMVTTVVQWLLIAPIMAGLTIMVSRIIFPQVSIAWLVSEVSLGNRAAGTLAAALVLFVGIVFLALVIWARA